ncbi:conjugal transfer protein TraG N-terminal domain-containing protein [Xenorhabdus eapokensis]|uniref:Conjugal transfer protein TraG n=1 Tax=Xenorhabdus eapokensis TaxID=1873482 RepID=A0A1Q5TH72_9GAMM|nr:conjugal transfer protein TraG N-terminal domain-containing protein [Xenorhabdus eapokensis]OKO99583.1 conjugal transfer protein TraG [Xenorhabdus eapokensis]
MTTNSYLEYFLTLLGWIINNGLWNILLSTGLFVVPLLFKVVGIWLKVREEGEDEGNKGTLSIVRIENAIYGAFIVMVFCCVPLFNISLSTMQIDLSRSKYCGTWIAAKPEDSGFRGTISSLDDKTAKAPIWWMLIHKVSKGITQASVATIPCRPDLRQVRFEVQHSYIKNGSLVAALQDFTNDCYSLALYDWKSQDQGKELNESVLRDIEWLGSRTFLNGAYQTLQSRTPRESFPWVSQRDDGYSNTGIGGYPTCAQWWSDEKVGLRKLVMEQADPGMWLRAKSAMRLINEDLKEFQEAVIRRLVSPASLQVSQGDSVYMGYGGNADFFTITSTATRAGSMVGQVLGSLAIFPALDAMRQSLPMVQSLLLMAIYVMLPLILMFSAYDFKTAVTLTFVIFALNFLTFWWELARWLDSWMIEALYSSDTHSRWNVMGIQNTSDDIIINFVMGTMFLVLPAVWMGALSWAGVKVGGTLETGAMQRGTAESKQAGGKGGEAATKGGTSAINQLKK